MDVKTTFLHGNLDEEIYMKQLEGFAIKSKKELVCKLKRSLYSVKQSPRMCTRGSTHIFVRSKVDHYVYYKKVGENFIYVVFYVDDMLLVGNNMEIIKEVKLQLSSKFDMKDLSAANLILGMKIKRNHADRKLWLNQRKNIETILHRFNMQECKPIKVPIPVGVRLYAENVRRLKKKKMICLVFLMLVLLEA